MSTALKFLILPNEITTFERSYLARVNRIAVLFLAAHVPAFALIAWFHGTGPVLAVVLTSVVLAGPVLARYATQNPRHISVVCGIAAMFMGGLLVHFGQGPVQIEMHFYFFALIAMCAVFGNPLVIVAAAVTVALHHLILWLVLPRSVFNYEAEWWVVGVHAAFVVLESVATCFISRSFFDNVIGLEKIVQTRTAALDSKNRDMRLLLDNVQQGFLTIDRAGGLALERSAAVDAWFGAPAPSASWFDYLATLSPDFAERTRFAWDDVLEDFMPLEVTLEQMPRRLASGGAHYRVTYRPIGATEPHENYLVIVTDVTTEVAREQAELERREAMALFEHLLADRAGFESFLEEASNIVSTLVLGRSTDANVVKRLIHTLKGNAASYGLQGVADECHALEDSLAAGGLLPLQAYSNLKERWGRLASVVDSLLGARSPSIEIDDLQYAALESAARSGESGPALLRRVRDLKLEPTARRLKHFQEQAIRIASRLGKGHIRVAVEDHGVRLDHHAWADFWGAFIHAVRNALDHGIEADDERAAAGKTAPGTLTLRTYEEKDRLFVEIADNGRGIDWQEVAKRAAEAGLPTDTALALERALFVDGISTATCVSDVSGRGVGMGALLAATRSLGGDLSIQSKLREGTTVRFAFPSSVLRAAEMSPPLAAVS
ncbi:MAG TPA: ATP-binding protein [Polyangiaceae bacterium]|jgi:two-component system chemotaxis sensor kinase CheA|nr:ATP-binding protein [Polyangiaceae bacterium]